MKFKPSAKAAYVQKSILRSLTLNDPDGRAQKFINLLRDPRNVLLLLHVNEMRAPCRRQATKDLPAAIV